MAKWLNEEEIWAKVKVDFPEATFEQMAAEVKIQIAKQMIEMHQAASPIFGDKIMPLLNEILAITRLTLGLAIAPEPKPSDPPE